MTTCVGVCFASQNYCEFRTFSYEKDIFDSFTVIWGSGGICGRILTRRNFSKKRNTPTLLYYVVYVAVLATLVTELLLDTSGVLSWCQPEFLNVFLLCAFARGKRSQTDKRALIPWILSTMLLSEEVLRVLSRTRQWARWVHTPVVLMQRGETSRWYHCSHASIFSHATRFVPRGSRDRNKRHKIAVTCLAEHTKNGIECCIWVTNSLRPGVLNFNPLVTYIKRLEN